MGAVVITMKAHCFHDSLNFSAILLSLVMVKCIILFKMLPNLFFDSTAQVYFLITGQKVAEVHSEPTRASKMELFAKSVTG